MRPPSAGCSRPSCRGLQRSPSLQPTPRKKLVSGCHHDNIWNYCIRSWKSGNDGSSGTDEASSYLSEFVVASRASERQKRLSFLGGIVDTHSSLVEQTPNLQQCEAFDLHDSHRIHCGIPMDLTAAFSSYNDFEVHVINHSQSYKADYHHK